MYKPSYYDYSKFCNQRNTDIYIMRRKGYQYKEIGEKYNISRVRARQIFERYQNLISSNLITDPYSES